MDSYASITFLYIWCCLWQKSNVEDPMILWIQHWDSLLPWCPCCCWYLETSLLSAVLCCCSSYQCCICHCSSSSSQDISLLTTLRWASYTCLTGCTCGQCKSLTEDIYCSIQIIQFNSIQVLCHYQSLPQPSSCQHRMLFATSNEQYSYATSAAEGGHQPAQEWPHEDNRWPDRRWPHRGN